MLIRPGERSTRATVGVLLTTIAAVLLGCLGPRVAVLPSGGHVRAEPKPADCQLEFLRTKVDRPYDEIAALHASGGDEFRNGPEDFQRALRSKACELGADALLVTTDFTRNGGVMSVVAIKYRIHEQ